MFDKHANKTFKQNNKPKWFTLPGMSNVKIAYWTINGKNEYETSTNGLPVTGGWIYEGN